MRDLGLKIELLPPTSAHRIVNYAPVQDLWLSGEGKLLVGDIIFGVQLFIHGEASSRGAWVPRRAAPLPVKVPLAFTLMCFLERRRSAALVLLAVQWLFQSSKAVGMQWSQVSLRPKVAPGMVRRNSSPLTTRWSITSSATFAMVWNPRIMFSWCHQSDPLHALDLQPYTLLPLARVPAEDDLRIL